MKLIKNCMLAAGLLLLSTNIYSQQSNKVATKKAEQRVAQRTIANAQKGDLICTDANGNYILCTGNISETVMGFTTNVPYVTPNKPATPNASKAIFEARASVANGPIKAGDYVAAGTEPGKVVKGDSKNAYAIALEDATANGQTFKVKVLQVSAR
jgi:hypothetical protein